MIKSMTAFGRGEASAGPFRATVEVRSVNHRFADLKIKLPPDLAPLEPILHRSLQKAVRRGRLDVTVSVTRAGEDGHQFEVNRSMVASYLRASEQIRADFGVEGRVSLETILALPDAVRVRPAESQLGQDERGALLGAFERALADHGAMREREGEILARDIRRRIEVIRRLQKRIARRAPRMIPLYAKRLKARIKGLDRAMGAGGRLGLDATRLAQEVALTAERSDITEELVRLAGYLEQLDTLLGQNGEPVGKKLDFIMQELNRESNTINSKAVDLAICQAALEMKAEVEKIREQVQNIE